MSAAYRGTAPPAPVFCGTVQGAGTLFTAELVAAQILRTEMPLQMPAAANKGRRFIDQQVGNNGPNHKQPGIDRAELIMLKGRERKVNVRVKN